MIKYRTGNISNKIEKVEVAGETAHFVKLAGGSKDAKRSEWRNYFETFDDAKNFLINRAQQRVESLRIELESANGALGQIKGIKES